MKQITQEMFYSYYNSSAKSVQGKEHYSYELKEINPHYEYHQRSWQNYKKVIKYYFHIPPRIF